MENSTDHHHATRQERKSKYLPTASWAAISTMCLSETDKTEQSTSEATLSLTDGKENTSLGFVMSWSSKAEES